MYYPEDREQLTIEKFFQPFGGKLRKDNRWVLLAAIMPWEYIEKVYLQNLSEKTGRPAIPSRMAFGAIFIKEFCHLTDEDTVQELQENSYMQYFVGLHEFQAEPLFDPSMMVHFRKRFPVEEVAKINEYVCTGKWPEEQRKVDRNDDGDEPTAPSSGEGGSKASRQKGKSNPNTSKKKKGRRKKNRGKLLLDATVAPADIKYPTDIDLLNKSREHLETAVNLLWQHVEHTNHKLPYSAKKARKSYLKLAKSKKWTQAKCRKAIGEQLRYIELASGQLEKYAAKVSQYETLFPRCQGSPCRDPNGVPPTEVHVRQSHPYLPGSDRLSGAASCPTNSAGKTPQSHRIRTETAPLCRGWLHLSGADQLEQFQ